MNADMDARESQMNSDDKLKELLGDSYLGQSTPYTNSRGSLLDHEKLEISHMVVDNRFLDNDPYCFDSKGNRWKDESQGRRMTCIYQFRVLDGPLENRYFKIPAGTIQEYAMGFGLLGIEELKQYVVDYDNVTGKYCLRWQGKKEFLGPPTDRNVTDWLKQLESEGLPEGTSLRSTDQGGNRDG